MEADMVLSRRAFPLVIAGLAAAFLTGACGDNNDLLIPTVYLVAGQVGDPTSNPLTPIPGARVWVETEPDVPSVTSDADGNFVLHGVSPGVHRLRAELPGRRTANTLGLVVDRNLTDAGIPLFTDFEIDSILTARGAAPWDTTQALFGMFALRANGLPIGSATIAFTPRPPSAGGTLVQTGVSEDPIVVVNAVPGDYSLSVSNPGFVWDNPYAAHLEPGILTFGLPRARPNIRGYVFADRSTGDPVAGATISVASGPIAGSSTTDFLGQFALEGMKRGLYTLGMQESGVMPGLSWPQDVQSDTTLTLVLFHADTLAAWSQALGGPLPAANAGHLAVEARNVSGGALFLGATLSVFPGGTGTPLAQGAMNPALVVNLVPGSYQVTVTGSTIAGSPSTSNVEVRAGTVTYTRLDLEGGTSTSARSLHPRRGISRTASSGTGP
jgi:hypothetical protein